MAFGCAQGFYTWNKAFTLLLLAWFVDDARGRVYPRQTSDTVIQTRYGKLKGLLVEIPNKKLKPVEVYMGLQYASVLGGDLRFMPPTNPMEKWDGMRVAVAHRPVCPQKIPTDDELERTMPKGRIDHIKRIIPFIRDQSEECLNLNIYVPAKEWERTFPVILFIHGESYSMGTGNAYDGSVLASFGQCIVITINYRLGVLGFMSTVDANAVGNYALLDLVAALSWIKANIGAFDGDPDRVTAMGQGYGAALVELLLVSPVIRGNLLRRGISMSGSALSTWAVTERPRFYARKLAHKVNCSQYIDISESLVKCFKSRRAETLVNADIEAPKYYEAFGPVIYHRSVLQKNVKILLERAEKAGRDSELLTGVMKNEGYFYLSDRDIEQGVTVDRKNRIVRTFVRNCYKFHRQKIFDILSHHYADWDREQDNDTTRNSVMELLGDAEYVAPSIDFARRHARVGATYYYAFTYPSRVGVYPRWAGGIHGEDLMYALGAPLADGIDPFPSTFTRSERMLSEAVMTYWTNFAKTGDPNKPEEQKSEHGGSRAPNRFVDLTWPAFLPQDRWFLHIAGMRPSIRQRYRGAKMSLWLDLIPKIHRPDDLDEKYHLLDQHNNRSSYDVNTLDVDGHLIFPPIPSTTAPTTTESTTQPTTTTQLITEIPRLTLLPAPTNPSQGGESSAATGNSLLSANSSLSITLAVGCSLLCLNILVFAGVYYQRDKMRGGSGNKHEQEREYLNKPSPQGGATENHVAAAADHRKMNSHHHHHVLPPGSDSEMSTLQRAGTGSNSNTVLKLPASVRTNSTCSSPRNVNGNSPTSRSPYSNSPPAYATMNRSYQKSHSKDGPHCGNQDGQNPVTIV
ncbi:neuroligin-4, Y-linked-like [Tubulanus polymorphus]|uniref:neuroligin-4, Y-linked-like n=1 Tax=Tubulanus polymorphus TaxID=672921 RepID=UPI003DA3FB63